MDPVTDQTAEVGKTFAYQVVGKDMDVEDTLVFTLIEKPSNMTISASGVISWTPTADQVGTHTVTVKVFDGMDETTASFTITVKVKEKEGDSVKAGSNLLMPILFLLVIIIVAVAVAVLMMRKKKGKGANNPPPQ
jgi:hypothetical protein